MGDNVGLWYNWWKMGTCKMYLTEKDMETYGGGYTKEKFMQHVPR